MNPVLFFTYTMNGLLMIGLAAGLGIWLNRRFKLPWRWWWLGALTFILSQIGHLPFNWGLTQMFNLGWLPTPPEKWQLLFNAIVLGLSAGLWEEFARYFAFRWYARGARTSRGSLMLGAGHGGIEAIILGVIVLATFIQLVLLREVDLSTMFPAEQLELAQQQVEAYWSAPWYLTILGAVERAFTLVFHISASLLVVQAFLRRNWLWLVLAIGWHAFVDAIAVLTVSIWGAIVAEIAIGGIAMLSMVIIWRLLRSQDLDPPVTPRDSAEFEQTTLRPISTMDDQDALDASRFQD